MKSRYLLIASLCIAATVAAAPAAAADTPRTLNRADAAAGWLARQMVDGDHFEASFGGITFPDQGLTIDAVFAFASARTAADNGAAALSWLARPDILSGYIGDGITESYAGPTAKASLAAQVGGRNPASFGGVNLPARLLSLLTPSGRFSDRSAFGDFSNGFSQALAIITLARTSGGAPASAVAFAVGTQCPDGGFPQIYDVSPCVSNTDATAMMVQALLATGRFLDAQQGLSWLVGQQQPGGGLPAGHHDENDDTLNANTTGLAGQAFRAGGRLVAALRAKAFILGLQVGCSGAVADRGAIAFDATGFDPALATRATPQGILGLGGTSLVHLTAAGSDRQAPVLACH